MHKLTAAWRRRTAPGVLALLLVFLAIPAVALGQPVEPVPGNLHQDVGDVVVPAGMLLQGSVTVGTGEARIHGRVEGNVEVATGEAEIYGEVGGDVRVTTGKVTLGDHARVEGDVVVLRGEVNRGPNSYVGGDVRVGSSGTVSVPAGDGSLIIDEQGIRGPGLYVGPEGIRIGSTIRIGPEGVHLPGMNIGPNGIRMNGQNLSDLMFHFVPNPFFIMLQWAGLFALSATALALMPAPLGRMASALDQRPLRAGLNGLAVMLLTPVALILLFVTIIGIPVALVGILGLVAAKFLGYVALSLWLGERLAQVVPALQGDEGARFLRLLGGSLVLAAAGMVPGLDFLTGMLGACLGLGVAWSTRLGTRPWGPTPPAPPPAPAPPAPAQG